MPVTITLNTLLAVPDYFAGMTMERHSRDPLVPQVFARQDSRAISQSGLLATLVFDNVPAGDHHFCVRKADGGLQWRSPRLRVETGSETFAFHVITVPIENTTFDAGGFESGFELPINEDVPDLDEDLNITELDVAILSDHIDVDGKGNIAKGDDWTILKSELRFDYDFNIVPTGGVIPTRFVKVVKFADMTLNLSNPVTGFGAFFMQEKINNNIRKTIQKKVNAQVSAQLAARTSGNLSDQQQQLVSATIHDVRIITDGTVNVPQPGGGTVAIPARKLQLAMDVSVPSSAVSGRGRGCLGVVASGFALLGLLAALVIV